MKKVYLLSIFIIFAFMLKAQDYKMNEKNLHLKEMQKREFLTKEKMYLQENEQKAMFLTKIEKLRVTLKSKKVKSSISVSANEQDSLALVAFYNSTNGDDWTDNENWLTGNVETWKGITLDADGRVTEINLGSNNLTGTLPVEIGDLIYLVNLELPTNKISGNLPAEIGNLVNLTYLDLAPNDFTGEIPSEIANLTKIDILWLNNSRFSGSIPVEIGSMTNLKYVFLMGNELTGSVPTEFNNLISLVNLRVDGNNLENLPDLSNLTSLSYFYINDNNFDFGDFEAAELTFSNISNVRYSPQANITLTRTDDAGNVILSPVVDGTNNSYQWFNDGVEIVGETSNTLTIENTEVGIFYCEITDTNYPDLVLKSNSEALNVTLNHGVTEPEYDALVAFYNSTNGASWTDNTNWLSEEDVANWKGVIVESYHVTDISLIENNLTGTLPIDIGNLINLTDLWLYKNNIEGSIPTEIGNLANLEWLALLENNFSGNIPTGIGNLTNLIALGLGKNNLSGDIPVEIGNLSNLEYLYLYYNELTGSIPSQINNLTNLKRIKINNNQFADLSDLSALTSLTDFYVSDNNFDFGDFETTGLTFSDIYNLDYSPQASIALTRIDDAGSVTFSFTVDGSNNTYQWYKDDVAISGANSNTLTVTDTDTGIYYCTITDANYYDLTLYTVAEGINANLTNGILTEEYDALIAIYNATGGNNWTDNTNWTTEESVANWMGITVEGTHVIGVDFYNNNLIGYIPSDVCNLTELTYIHLEKNQLTDLPDLSSLTKLENIYVYRNKLTFEDIEPNIGVASGYFGYSPQANVGDVQEYILTEGESQTISVTVGGDNNTYQWYKDDVAISGATSDTYEITDFTSADAGVYVCKINNTVATDLELVSNNITLNEATVNVEEVNNNFVIYPNPTNSILNIKFEEDNITSIEIVDLIGKVLLNKVNANKFETFDISNLENGIYFIIIKSDNNISTSKIVKN